jgi:K+ transporter
VNALGGHPVIGVVAFIVASVALITGEYIRLTGDSRRLAYMPLIRIISMTAVFVSIVLIASRFIDVWFP